LTYCALALPVTAASDGGMPIETIIVTVAKGYVQVLPEIGIRWDK
jgi:hypothetical protein